METGPKMDPNKHKSSSQWQKHSNEMGVSGYVVSVQMLQYYQNMTNIYDNSPNIDWIRHKDKIAKSEHKDARADMSY